MHPAIIYLFKVNNRNGRKKCETCSELTIKTAERRHRRLVFLLLTLNTFIPHFEQVNVSQEGFYICMSDHVLTLYGVQ